MNLELTSSKSVTRLLTTLRQVRRRTESQLADLPDSDSGRYRYLKGFERELDRLILGDRKSVV